MAGDSTFTHEKAYNKFRSSRRGRGLMGPDVKATDADFFAAWENLLAQIKAVLPRPEHFPLPTEDQQTSLQHVFSAAVSLYETGKLDPRQEIYIESHARIFEPYMDFMAAVKRKLIENQANLSAEDRGDKKDIAYKAAATQMNAALGTISFLENHLAGLGEDLTAASELFAPRPGKTP